MVLAIFFNAYIMLFFFMSLKPDELYMAMALKLAGKGRGMTSPNPMVGAVLVKEGRIIAQGFHEKAGSPHAEAMALEQAGKKAQGASLFVSLEPCCHLKKRTPPCTAAIIRSGVKEVIAAMEDPNPAVCGKGLEEIKKAGITVRSGVLEKKARLLNEAYIKYITERTPFVTLKAAMSLDGKIATAGGESKWITGPEARRMVHQLRAATDAIITAVGTVLADDPELTVRLASSRKKPGGQAGSDKNPVRVVIDPELVSPLTSKIFRTPPRTIVVTRKKPLPPVLALAGVESINYEGKLSLKWLLGKLAAMGMISVLIEGGSSLNAHAFDEDVVDKAVFFYAPKIFGGVKSIPAVGGHGVLKLDEAWRLRDISIKRAGEDFFVTGYIEHRS